MFNPRDNLLPQMWTGFYWLDMAKKDPLYYSMAVVFTWREKNGMVMISVIYEWRYCRVDGTFVFCAMKILVLWFKILLWSLELKRVFQTEIDSDRGLGLSEGGAYSADEDIGWRDIFNTSCIERMPFSCGFRFKLIMQFINIRMSLFFFDEDLNLSWRRFLLFLSNN